jgi:hypothetical protein
VAFTFVALKKTSIVKDTDEIDDDKNFTISVRDARQKYWTNMNFENFYRKHERVSSFLSSWVFPNDFEKEHTFVD